MRTDQSTQPMTAAGRIACFRELLECGDRVMAAIVEYRGYLDKREAAVCSTLVEAA